MGKSRSKSKLHSLRSSLLSSHPIDLNINAIKDELLDEIMKKLMSGKPSDRHLGAEMISNSISNLENYKREELVELIRTLSPLCCDRAENVRYATTDALCHLSSLSDELCDLMIDSDVMTPIIQQLIDRFSDYDWNNSKKSQLVHNIYIDSCRLLTNLCGSSYKALKLYNNSNLSQILIKGLKSFDVNIEVSIASAQCLSVVVEENIIPDLLKEENIELIRSLLMSLAESPSRIHLSTLVAFIASNLSLKSDSEALNLIFNVINKTLSISCLQQLKELSENIREFVENEKQNDLLNKNYEELKNLLLAKRVSLELLTNITCFEDDSNDEDMMDCDNNDSEDEDIDPSNNLEDNELNISPELENKIVENSIISKIAEHLGSVDILLRDNLIKHNFGKEILYCIQSVQECSLASIHNIVLSVSNQRIGIDEHIWSRIYDITFSSNQFSLIEESTNTMRAIITQYIQIKLTGDELEKLCIICHNKNASNTVKINVIKLMSILAERSTDLIFIEKISSLLLSALKNESDLVIRAEIFDAIIDIFSEDYKTDAIVKKIDLINNLKESALQFKKETNKTRQKSKQNPIISTVKLNLMRFVQYKEKMLYKANK